MKINNFKFKFEIFKCFDVICHFQSLLKGLCWQQKKSMINVKFKSINFILNVKNFVDIKFVRKKYIIRIK